MLENAINKWKDAITLESSARNAWHVCWSPLSRQDQDELRAGEQEFGRDNGMEFVTLFLKQRGKCGGLLR